jgi:hypothetical protein
LNLTHIPRDEFRIENRFHQGTLNAEKARHWLRLCLRMVDHAVTRSCQFGEPLPNSRESLDKLLITIGLKPNIYKTSSELRETGRWISKRWKQLNPATPQPRSGIPVLGPPYTLRGDHPSF